MPGRYSSGAIVLHWLLASGVVLAGVLGLLHDSWPRHSHAFWTNFHALAGILMCVVLIARFWLLLLEPRFSPRLTCPLRLLLYALLPLTTVSGLMAFIWHGRVLNLGAWQIDFGVPEDRTVFELAEDIHGYMAYAIFLLSGAHVAAVLWHHFLKRDGSLRNMWWKI